MFKTMIGKRRLIQGVLGILLFFSVSQFHVNLLYVILLGGLAGILLGKVFCRWACPIGFIMELLTGTDPENRNQQLYMYHKLGCPIAWISGFLNRFSLLKIKRSKHTCNDCGKCDKVCYISSLNKEFSIHKENKKNPSTDYSCSKCLECIKSCPTNSLHYQL